MFWQRKKVCVTGGAGMIGNQLVRLLLDAGAQVEVLDDFSRGNVRHDGATYPKVGFWPTVSDAGTIECCAQAFHGKDVVFNLAAKVGGVLFNVDHHAYMLYQNARLQTTPVMAAKAAGVKTFVQVSSVCVYHSDYNKGAHESDGHKGEPEGANAGYAIAKRVGEKCALFAGFDKCVIVRPTNAYGPHDYFDDRAHVIPALIKKFIHDDIVHANGTGDEVREFIYSVDAARAMMIAAEHGKNGWEYNISNDGADRVDIHYLAHEINTTCIEQGVYKKLKEVVFAGGESGDTIRWAQSERIEELGWSPRMSLRDGLWEVVKWYRQTAQ